MNDKSKKIIGVIEGFYGKPWSWSARNDYVDFLSEVSLGAYIYAPKSDKKLRTSWAELWTEEELLNLEVCSNNFKSSGLSFGIGFSPLALVGQDLTTKIGKKLLEELNFKLKQIATIQPDIFCILFDDLSYLGKDMVISQLKICDMIFSKIEAKKFIICPSYYTTDPILENIFGPMPENYWCDLGKGLDSQVDFFWTGENVCSENFNKNNLDFIAQQFARLPVLWDNYPVNDGQKLSRFLRIKPFVRDKVVTEMSSGHVANPMNQPYLSQLPLSTLANIYESDKRECVNDDYLIWKKFAESRLGEDLTELFFSNIDNFSLKGLDGLSRDEKINLEKIFKIYNHPCVIELIDWLNDKYKFDPTCLTS